MAIRLGMIMEPIETTPHIKKNGSVAILLEAYRRGWEIHTMQQKELFLLNGTISAKTKKLSVEDDSNHWFDILSEQTISLKELDVIFIRIDPPFDMNYLYTTYLLELAERNGVLIVNKPQAVRDANEKLFTHHFLQCCPPTLVTKKASLLSEFLKEQKEIILKPLNHMGGKGVFRLTEHDENTDAIIEMSTQYGTTPIMAQRFIKEITQGDKRILMINGIPIPYALARIPQPGKVRANISAGGYIKGTDLTDRDKWICDQVGETLRKKGLLFVGLDIIGEYLTEINVTCPTCIRQLDSLFDLNIAGQLLDEILTKVSA